MKQVKLYGTASCPQCQAVKKYLEGKKVDFEYIDVFKDNAGLEYLTQLGIKTLPVTTVGAQYATGFYPQEIDGLLGGAQL